MKNGIDEKIQQLSEFIDDEIKSNDMKIKKLLKTLNILIKYKDRKPSTKEEIKEVMSMTCFDNIAYCCGIKKDCFWRDLVLLILRIDKKEFKKAKDEFGFELASTH